MLSITSLDKVKGRKSKSVMDSVLVQEVKPADGVKRASCHVVVEGVLTLALKEAKHPFFVGCQSVDSKTLQGLSTLQ